MSCEGCWQKQRQENEAQIQILKDAKKLANETGEWIGIYNDAGQWCTVRASLAASYPNIQQWATPDR